MNVPTSARLCIALVLTVLIVMVSIVPGRQRPGDSGFVWLVSVTPVLAQKGLHVIAYAALSLLWIWALEKIVTVPLRLTLAFFFTVTIGAALEWYQTSVPGRFGTLADVLLNAIGSLVGIIVAMFLL